MSSAFNLPRLVLGSGALNRLDDELALIGIKRPLLVSDRGIARAGLVERVLAAAPAIAATFLEVPENPTAQGADAALQVYREMRCDGVVALGGGSVLDTAKIVAAVVGTGVAHATDVMGKPSVITAVAALIAIPTTLGTGSESSPVAALHLYTNGPGVGTRHRLLVPLLALCDADLARTLPRRLIAATAIDALSHCIEGFFAEPANPVIDALALDGVRRVFTDVSAALEPEGDAARESLMAAAFSGGAAIHKGLGPAHAVATVCGEQDVHHGTLIGVVLPHATTLVAEHVPDKAARLRSAIGLEADASIGKALQDLLRALALPESLSAAGYKLPDREPLIVAMVKSHFNLTTPYKLTIDDYRRLLQSVEPD